MLGADLSITAVGPGAKTMARHSFRTSLAATLMVAAFVALAAQPAQASGITCSAALASKVTPTTACEIGSTNNDTLGGIRRATR